MSQRGSLLTDLGLNQNAHAAESLYRQREPATRLFAWSTICDLRREFDDMAADTQGDCFDGTADTDHDGGAIRNNFTLRVLEPCPWSAWSRWKPSSWEAGAIHMRRAGMRACPAGFHYVCGL